MRATCRSALYLTLFALVVILCAGAGDSYAAYTASAPYTTQITVVNTNGVPQAATQIMDLSRGTKVGVADTSGNAVVGVNVPTGIPAWTDSVTATRQVPEYVGDPCWSAPEGAGVAIQLWTGIFDQLPASTVTVPALDGPGYAPETSTDEWSLLTEINEKRVSDHVSPVTLSTVLTASAASYVNILPISGLDPTAPSTYCLNSGPGMRAIDAGFPTFDVGEDIVQNAATPDAALASLESYDHAGLLTDPDMTTIGIASKAGTWVIDTSIIALTDPGHERAGDTGNTALPAAPSSCPPPSCPSVSPSVCPLSVCPPATTTRMPKLKLVGIEHHRHSLVVYARLLRHAKGKLRVSAVRKPSHRSRAHASRPVLGRHLYRRHGRVHATLHLRPGRWRVRVRFIGDDGWSSVLRRRTVLVHRPRGTHRPHLVH